MAVWIGRIFGAFFVLSCIAYVAGCGGGRVSTGASRSTVGQEKTQEPEPDRQPVAQEGCPTRITQQLHFQYESSYVSSASFFVIDDITDAMAKYPDMKVTVVGHASSQEQHAVSLSRARAIAVLKLLVSGNVAPGRLSAAGRGNLAPIVPNDTDEFRALNRRVEFVITDCRNGQGLIAKEPMDTTSVYLREHGTCRRSDAATPARDVTSTTHDALGAGSPDGGLLGGRLPPEVIQTIVRRHYGAFRACYEDGLRRASRLQGRVTVRFVINRDGVVSNVQNASSDMPDAKVVKCVMERYYDLCFPPPEENGIVTVVYPIMFSPGD